jgi:hypothetical protein
MLRNVSQRGKYKTKKPHKWGQHQPECQVFFKL